MNNKHKFWIVIILVLGLFLRTYNIDSQSVWFDESVSMHTAHQSLGYVLTFDDPTPPFYYLLLFFWMKILPFSDVFARLLSVFFGVASIYMIYLISKKIFGEKVALISALLLAISPTHIYYSQEIRCYSLLILMSLFSIYYFYKCIIEKFDLKNSFLYIIFTLGMIYTQVFGYFVIIMEILFLIYYLLIKNNNSKKQKNIFVIIKNNFFKNRSSLINWISIHILIQLLYLSRLLKQLSVIGGDDVKWLVFPSWNNIIDYYYNITSGIIYTFPGIILFSISIFLIVFYFIREKNSVKKFFMFTFLFLPPVILIIISLISPVFMTRYLIITIIPLIIILSPSINYLKLKWKKLIIICILILTISQVFLQANTLLRDPWREVSNDISNYNIPHNGDNNQYVTGIITRYESFPYSYYLDHECFLKNTHIRVYECMRAKSIIPITDYEDIDLLIENKKIILIESKIQVYPEDAKLLENINSNYHLIYSEVYLYPEVKYDFLKPLVYGYEQNITVKYMQRDD